MNPTVRQPTGDGVRPVQRWLPPIGHAVRARYESFVPN